MPASPARVAELKASVSAKKAEAQQKQQELVQIRAAKDAMAQELYDLRRPKSSGGSLKIRPKISMPTAARDAWSTFLWLALLLGGVYAWEKRAFLAEKLGVALHAAEDQLHEHGVEHLPWEGDDHGDDGGDDGWFGGDDDHHDGGGGHGHGHGDSSMQDLQATLAICVMLVLVTIVFEKVKHHAEHAVPPLMQNVLKALFGELTVLGFIALYAFMMLKLGLLPAISRAVYGNDDHLLHLFETVHFMLFFVMVTFLIEALVLVRATLKAEKFWMDVEKLITEHGTSKDPVVAQLMSTYKASAFNCCRRFCCPRPLWRMRIDEARIELRYALLRERFISPSKPQPNEKPLPPDFDFSNYLRRRCCEVVTHVLHVSTATWLSLIVFLALCLEMPVLLSLSHAQVAQVYPDAPDHVDVYWLVGLGWGLWLLSWMVQAKVDGIVAALTPPHPLLKRAPPANADDEEAPTTALLLESAASPAYEFRNPTKSRSKHETLFWFGREGPGLLVWLMRVQMLLCATSLAIISQWSRDTDAELHAVLLALLPILHVMMTAPAALLPAVTVATSVEQMRDLPTARETVLEMKTEKTLRVLKLLTLMQAQARKAIKMQKAAAAQKMGVANRPKKPPKAIGAAELAELRAAFELFDKDKSGTIDKAELGALMQSLGQTLSDSDLAALVTEMSTDGDELIDFHEFCEAMARGADDEQSPREMAHALFEMMDKDRSGVITLTELKATLQAMDPSLTDDDMANVLEMFDADRTGEIGKHEFIQALETMKTFG